LNLNLEGHKVIVFGAARGIGHAIAERFANEGSRVVGFDLVQPMAASDAPASNAPIEFLCGDVTHIGNIESVAEQHDDIQHVVYCVGIGSGRVGFPFWNLKPADWSRVIDVNLMGAVNVAHVFAPRLSKKGCGTLLNLVSVAGQIGSQTDPPYSAAKAALINFTQCAAKDLAPFGVRVNALSPGMVKTELNQSVWKASMDALPKSQHQSYDDWASEKLRRVAPLARWQSPEECASVAVFLASNHAQNITGQTINVDGGQVMHC
jgi:2-hydroxycyclohexanecarboxyl-CoA dehydrogenase